MTFGLPRNVCLLLVFIGVLSANEASARKWTDSTGKFSVEADFVELAAGQVTLKRSDGGLIRLPLARLSEADQQHVRSLTAPATASQPQSFGTDQTTAASPKATPPQAAIPSSGDATQTVIAEGVGTNADDALKDALRTAVSQVVGAVVDAETLVKNDELIDDKILMYSNAFVKTYERISEKSQGGLLRVKIRAIVERRSLIAKLKAENVTVKNVDGQGLFAEAITKIDEGKGAEALLRKALEGFPGNCIKAQIVGKPELIAQAEEKATIRTTVEFRADATACKAFGGQLQEILEKVAREKGDFIVAARQERPQGTIYEGVPVLFKGEIPHPFWVYAMMPRVFPSNSSQMRQEGQFVVALNTAVNKLCDRTQWAYYCLDEGLKKPFVEAATQQTECTISLLNSDGDQVLADRFQLEPGPHEGYARFPITLLAVSPAPSAGAIHHFTKQSTSWDVRDTNLFLISSIFFEWYQKFTYVPVVTLKRDLQLSLEELKSVASIRCALEFPQSPVRDN